MSNICETSLNNIKENKNTTYVMDDMIKQQFVSNFKKCVKGYHLLNASPINETIWETINSEILEKSGCKVLNMSNGSHSSGRDIICDIGGLSNKSAKYNKSKNEFSISSYRLTTVCSNKDCGTVEKIINEINSRKNYDYYSFIVRNEQEDDIEYDWYLIPSDHQSFNPESYNWIPMFGQRGKKIGEQIGWKTNEINGSKMSITFSMSSQLWLSISVTDDLKSFIMSSCKVNKKTLFNYSEIYEMFSKNIEK
jgi:hypothetical protein